MTETVAKFIATGLDRALPEETAERSRSHILDTIAAAVSGSELSAGINGASYVRSQSTTGPSVLITGEDRLLPPYAAMANAMASHADETDDSHELSRTHPGASIVPSALAQAEAIGCTGREFVRAVAVGYDVGCRVNMALWPERKSLRSAVRSTHAVGGAFGSAAAIATLRRLTPERIGQLLSYVGQQASGTITWRRDTNHIEKAYVFAGLPAFQAFLAHSVVEAGWTGVADVFDGTPNFLDAVGSQPDPSQLVADLGVRFEVERTNIKQYSVGSPAQAPLQGLIGILREQGLKGQDVNSVEVRVPTLIAEAVGGSARMPDINLPYLLDVALADGDLSFAMAHSEQRFKEWLEASAGSRVTVNHDEMMELRRQAIVEVTTHAGQSYRAHVKAVRGTVDNPMSQDEVKEKAVGLMAPVIGVRKADDVSDSVLDLDALDDLAVLTEQLRRRP